MANEWHTAVLGDLTINHDGKRKPVKESDRRPGPYPYYGASGIVDYVDGYLFDGDFLFLNPCCLQRVPAPRAPAYDFSAV